MKRSNFQDPKWMAVYHDLTAKFVGFYLAIAFVFGWEAAIVVFGLHFAANLTVDLDVRIVNQILKGRRK